MVSPQRVCRIVAVTFCSCAVVLPLGPRGRLSVEYRAAAK